MIIAMVGPVKEDIESSYEFITTTNDFVYVDIEDLFSDMTDADYNKYVLSNPDLVYSLLKKMESEYGSFVVYGDTAFTENDVLTKIVKDGGIVVITAREDVSSYSEFDKYKDLDADDTDLYESYVDWYQKLSDIADERVFFNDVLSGDPTLYDVIELIDAEEVEDSNDSEFSPESYILELVNAAKKTPRKKQVVNKKQDNPVVTQPVKKVNPSGTNYSDAIKKAMSELGMDDIAEEVVSEIDEEAKDNKFPMNEPEVKTPKETPVPERTAIISMNDQPEAKITKGLGITFYLPETTTLEYVVRDGVRYAALTVQAEIPFK